MSLAHGTIHAEIWAPPKFFVVDTPSAVATDLGCAYTLQVDPSGAGLVRVTSGWVGFEFRGREAFIPQQAVCRTRPAVGPGTPYYEDAPSGYADALTMLDFGPANDPGARRRARYGAVQGTPARCADAVASAHPRDERRAAPRLRPDGRARAAALGRHPRGRAACGPSRHRSMVECPWPGRRVVVADLDAGVVRLEPSAES